MVKDGLEFICFFYSCILLSEIGIQNSQLLMRQEGGIKQSIQGSELPPNSHERPKLTALLEVNSLTQVLGHANRIRSLYEVPAGYTAHAHHQCKHQEIPQNKKENQFAQRRTTVHGQNQTHAPLGKEVSP